MSQVGTATYAGHAMSDQPTSFHDFKWACGHIGPGHCKICHDALSAENTRLREVMDRAYSVLGGPNDINLIDLANAMALVDSVDKGQGNE